MRFVKHRTRQAVVSLWVHAVVVNEHMRPRLTSALIAMALLGCTEKPITEIKVRFDGEELFVCHRAEVSELTPTPGGWAFKCDDGSSVYFVYETADTPAKGTIETITITPVEAPQVSDLHVMAAPGIDCSSAKADRGADAFPTGPRGPKPGRYTMALAKPCGTLEVVISER
jgi:hypothetical protein